MEKIDRPPSTDNFGKSQPFRINEQTFNKLVIVLTDNWVKYLNIKNQQYSPIFVILPVCFESKLECLNLVFRNSSKKQAYLSSIFT